MTSGRDLFIDINTFNVENISYVKPILFYKVTKSMGIYYKKPLLSDSKSDSQLESKIKSSKKNNSDTTPIKRKIIIKTPKMSVPFNIKEFENKGKKTYKLSLSFNTLTNIHNEEEIKKFFYFIEKIDQTNKETVDSYKKKWGLPSNIEYIKTIQFLSENFPPFMSVNLPYDEKLGFLFHVYDDELQKSSIDIIEKRSIISLALELTELRFGETDYRSAWTVLQIKKHKPYSEEQEYFMKECLIHNDKESKTEDISREKIIQIVESYMQGIGYMNQMKQCPIPIHIPIPIPPTPYIRLPPPPPPPMPSAKSSYRPPSLSELLQAKKSLKKTFTVEKSLDLHSIMSGEKSKSDSFDCDLDKKKKKHKKSSKHKSNSGSKSSKSSKSSKK